MELKITSERDRAKNNSKDIAKDSAKEKGQKKPAPSRSEPPEKSPVKELLQRSSQKELIPQHSNIELKSIQTLTNKREITHELRRDLDIYLRDIEKITITKIPLAQKREIKRYVENNRARYLTFYVRRTKREEFDAQKRQLIKTWEEKTGRKWPTYDKVVRDESGKIYRRKGQQYDAHHIVELSFGGPAEWWNIYPASSPDQHQNGIHRKGGIADKIFVKPE